MCLRVNILVPGLGLMKKNLPGRGLTKAEKHCSVLFLITTQPIVRLLQIEHIKLIFILFFFFLVFPFQVWGKVFLLFLESCRKILVLTMPPMGRVANDLHSDFTQGCTTEFNL
jgi:hypothetical protein